MTHDEALQLLSARIDSPLSTDQQHQLDTWLAESPDHTILAEAFQTQHGELRTAFEPRRDAASRTASAVARQLPIPPMPAAEPAVGRWRRLLFGPIPAACAAALLIAIGLIVFRGKNTPGPDHPTVAANNSEPYAGVGLKPRDRPDLPKTIALTVGDIGRTLVGEKRRYVLPDGSFLYLNQETKVELTTDRHVKVETGEVFVEAVTAKTESERFIVETPNRSVTALGTKFAVRATEKGTGVLVAQGKVEVSGLAGKVATGWELQPGFDKIVAAPRASAALDWTKELMAAAESPLVPAGKYSGGSLVAVDPYGQEAKLSLVKFHVDVYIEEGFARTTIDQTYFNSENSRMEGTFYFPLPPDASLSRLAMYVDGDLMEGGMADRDLARDVYERIRYQNRDPALLEWVDGSVFKMRVFPLEARQEKRIVLSYTQRLPVLYGRSTYRFPAGHTLAVVDQWSFQANVKDGARLSAMSPSHPRMKLMPQGKDLIATDEAKGVKVDRDVVLELVDHQAAQNAEAARWSQGELDGQKYLMVRYKPALPVVQRRERRDWVFLFESSGARDPLVARAQVEVIRSLLAHAEHEDTFAILSVGTRIRKWNDGPQLATPENVADAVKWLESRHLIGALNLDQALSDAAALLQAGSNPHLVHVGGGVASIGEQRADELVKRIPVGTRYVGIGVGKRVSPALMKVAAERTGGLFTQVNPDEPISWRGFEIASTLNAPRLLDINVTTPGVNGVRFLTFSNALADGEELAAIANVTHAMPTSVVIEGTLDGQRVHHAVPVSNVAAGAGYLPRSWAKLEIDRLLAVGSDENRKAVTELSKAMYVMTPFTSLLVLENEQMYKDFKVDRGRKDHWAMYACPAKIPVVFIPDPNLPAGSNPDLKGQKPHANQVAQTIMVRNPPQFLTWPGHGVNDVAVATAGQNFGAAFAVPDDVTVLGDLDGIEIEALAEKAEKRLMETDRKDIDRLVRSLPRGGTRFRSESEVAELRASLRGTEGRGFTGEAWSERKLKLRQQSRGFGSVQSGSGSIGRLFEDSFATGIDIPVKALSRRSGKGKSNLELLGVGQQTEFFSEYGLSFADAGGEPVTRFKRQMLAFSPDGTRAVNGQLGNLDLNAPVELAAVVAPRQRVLIEKLRHAADDRTPAMPSDPLGDGDGDRMTIEALDALSAPPTYYGRPSFSGSFRVFNDLVAYAPGMSSSLADMRAVTEAEAAPRFGSRRGSIDPNARKLIDAARTTEWKELRIGGPNGIPFVHDGTGRYAFERRVALGLLERVVCDGMHLWHLYPELGIGAKRTVSRFHRAPLIDLIPDFVPPADDLCFGADVKAIDAKTVALIPLRSEKEDEPKDWLEVHLAFDGPRLVERRWVLQPNKEVLAREVYEPGTTRLVARDKEQKDKELEKLTRATKPVAAPSLRPDVKGLVVLPLPLRSREKVYGDLGLEPGAQLNQDRNACFQYMEDDAIMQLLTAEFAANNGHNVGYIWLTRFANDSDMRTGFFTLMASAGQDPRSYIGLDKKFEANPSDPLVRYLWELHDSNIHDWQARLGFGPGSSDAESFLGKLTSFRRIVTRWNGGYINHDLWGQRDGERRRAIEFAVQNADNPLGWCSLALVNDRCPNQAAWKAVADAWAVLAEKSSLRYPALYERARSLGYAGQAEAAQEKYQTLFRAALKEGVLPPLDSSFRSVLEGGKDDTWAKLMRDTAAKTKARPVIVTLAWQCYQLGDIAMADTLLDQALAPPVPAEQKRITSLAAIHFLNATARYDRADQLVRGLLSDPKLATEPGLWRLASQISDNRKDSVRAIECLEKAIDIEYAHLPEVFDVQPIRNDYGRLLGHYEWLSDASTSLQVAPPKDLVARVVKAADRWRHLDPEAADVPNRVATILRKVGGEAATDLAWDYATTPLALKPNESSPWTSLAWSLRQEGNWKLADRCYELAFLAEPTNAQLLWDRAQHLQQQGQEAESRNLKRQLAGGDWQPRFNGLKAQARQAVEGR
ncbi:MAG TPA: VIT domain-containing protein [Gemmataceae bacterium]|nr:VIT domain-containing protein [Gemmataceae bacterium]